MGFFLLPRINNLIVHVDIKSGLYWVIVNHCLVTNLTTLRHDILSTSFILIDLLERFFFFLALLLFLKYI